MTSAWHKNRDERRIDEALARNPVAPYPWHDWNHTHPMQVRHHSPPPRARSQSRARALAELDLWTNEDNLEECGEPGCSVVVTLSGVRRSRARRDSEGLLALGADLDAPGGAWFVYAERFGIDEVALHVIPQARRPGRDEADQMLRWLSRQVCHWLAGRRYAPTLGFE